MASIIALSHCTPALNLLYQLIFALCFITNSSPFLSRPLPQVLWDLQGRRCLPQLAAHRGHPLSVLTWSPDGNLLLTGAADCMLRVWRVVVPPPQQQQQHSTRSVTGGGVAGAAGASGGLAPPPAALVELGGGAATAEGDEIGFFVADAAITSACFAGEIVRHERLLVKTGCPSYGGWCFATSQRTAPERR